MTATVAAPAAAPVRGRFSPGWVAAGVVWLAVVVVSLAAATTGTAGDPRIANPHPGPAPYRLSGLASPVASSVLTLTMAGCLAGTLVWLSLRQRRLHWAAAVALATLPLGLLDPVANWSTFAVLNPAVLHYPTTWPWFRLSPLVEPVLSVVGGYSSYYVLTGLLVYWLARKMLRQRESGTTLFLTAYAVSLPFNALLQFEWIKNGILVYTQFAGPVFSSGHVHLPLLVLLYDPFVYATVAVLCRWFRSRRATGRAVAAATACLLVSVLVPVGAFAAVRASGAAGAVTYDAFPYPVAKTYDPYDDLVHRGKPGPFYR